MKLFGLVGWSGSGKTTLIEQLIPLLTMQGVSVSTIKHAHHGFDIDRPGKDSFRHRRAGAREVVVASAARWALLHEGGDGLEPRLADLVTRLAAVDLVLIEGFKAEPHAKIEVYRAATGQAPMADGDSTVLAIASDTPLPPGLPHPRLDLNDAPSIAAFILRCTSLSDIAENQGSQGVGFTTTGPAKFI